jgi:hypothetical protein
MALRSLPPGTRGGFWQKSSSQFAEAAHNE